MDLLHCTREYLARCLKHDGHSFPPPMKRRRVITSPPSSPSFIISPLALSKYLQSSEAAALQLHHALEPLVLDPYSSTSSDDIGADEDGASFFDINALPNEILEHIFSFLPPGFVRTRARLVCHHWGNISLLPTFWQTFEFPKASCTLATDCLLRILSLPRFNRLQSLVFGWTHKVDDSILGKLLLANPNLKNSLLSLEIHRCSGVDDRSSKKIAQFKNLRCLKLYNSSNWKGITDTGVKELCTLTNLQVLQLNFFKRLSNKSIKELQTLKNLKELYISGAPLVSDQGITALSLPQFASLSLSLCGTLTDKTLFAIPKNFPSLQFLSLGYNNPSSFFTDAGLAALKDLRELKELRLERSWGHLSGDGVRTLRLALPNLLVRNW